MQNEFMSDENITNQTKKLILELKIPTESITKDIVHKCRNLVQTNMKGVYGKYGEKKPQSMNNIEYVRLMNNKSVKNSKSMLNEQPDNQNSSRNDDTSMRPRQKKISFGHQSNDDQRYMRPNELMKQYNHPEQNKNPSKEFASFQNDGGGYASISNNPTGPFMTATGEYGMPLAMENEDNGMNKKVFSEETEDRFNNLRMNGGYSGQMPMGGGMSAGANGGGQMNNGMNGGMSGGMGGGNNGYYGVPPSGEQPNITPDVAKWLNLEGGRNANSGQSGQYQNQQSQELQNLQSQAQQLQNQMQQMNNSGQMTQQLSSQFNQQLQQLQQKMNSLQSNNMTNTNSNMGNNGMNNNNGGNQGGGMNNMNMNNMNSGYNSEQGQMGHNQGQMNPGVDYGFAPGGDDMGNDFNSAYQGIPGQGGQGAPGGSQGGQYNGFDSLNNSYTDPSQNRQNNGGGSSLDSRLDDMKASRNSDFKPQRDPNFDPMKSPYQTNQNQQQQNQQQNRQQMNNNGMNNNGMNNNMNNNRMNNGMNNNGMNNNGMNNNGMNNNGMNNNGMNNNGMNNNGMNNNGMNNNNNGMNKFDNNQENSDFFFSNNLSEKKSNTDKQGKTKKPKKTKKHSESSKKSGKKPKLDELDDEIYELEKQLKKDKKKSKKKSSDVYGLEEGISEIRKEKKEKTTKNMKEINEYKKNIDEINDDKEARIKILAGILSKAKEAKEIKNEKKINSPNIFEDNASDNESNDSNESKESNKSNKSCKNKEDKRKKMHISSNELEIDCSKISQREGYNDYMVSVDKYIKIVNINKKECVFPKNTSTNINNKNNTLLLYKNEKEIEIEISEDYYNRYELVDSINDGLDANDIDVKCSINDDDLFQFKSENNEKFTIKNTEKSILNIIGFKKNVYINKNNYTADRANNLADNIYYVLIENINEKPMFYINLDDDEIKKIEYESDDDNVKFGEYLLIKIYKTKNEIIKNDIGYSHFFENKHVLNFEIEQKD
jgi:hypothetical protein